MTEIKVGDKFLYEYPKEPQFSRIVTVVEVTGDGPDDLILFDDYTHSKVKYMTGMPRLP